MSTVRTILDTDIVNYLMRDEPAVKARARAYLLEHRRLTFSVITRFEALRGLMLRGAIRRQLAFEQLCSVSEVLPVTDEIARQAALIYTDLRGRGLLIDDGDILIAATALVHGLTVTTSNEAHYRRIGFLTVDNWLRG